MLSSRILLLFSGIAVLLLVFAEGYRFNSSLDRSDHVFIVSVTVSGLLYAAVKDVSAWWLIPQWVLSLAAATYIVRQRQKATTPTRPSARRLAVTKPRSGADRTAAEEAPIGVYGLFKLVSEC